LSKKWQRKKQKRQQRKKLQRKRRDKSSFIKFLVYFNYVEITISFFIFFIQTLRKIINK